MMYKIKIKRIYEPYQKTDGFRVLVDRLWPRGIDKEKGHIDVWLKEVAPSNFLRKWFNHDVTKWKSFVEKFYKELQDAESIKELVKLLQEHKTITLLYAAKDMQHNNAVALQEFLKKASDK